MGISEVGVWPLSASQPKGKATNLERVLSRVWVPPQTRDPQAERSSPGRESGQVSAPACRDLRQNLSSDSAGGLGGCRLSVVGAPKSIAAPLAALDPTALSTERGSRGGVAGHQPTP